jgi:transcriptional regulator with XRE-family HTH domain
MPYRVRGKAKRRKTFLREWREHHNLSLDRAASRFVEFGVASLSGAQLSRVEKGQSPYTQDFLEVAALVYNTDIASLLMRNPAHPESIWSIWDQANAVEREQIEDVARALIKRRA